MAAGMRSATLLSVRITKPPAMARICVNGMNTTGRGVASGPPSWVFAATPTMKLSPSKPFSTTFVVSQPPRLVDGAWKMTVDGVELTRRAGLRPDDRTA